MTGSGRRSLTWRTLFAPALMLLLPAGVAGDSLKITRADPPKSVRLPRDSGAIKIEVGVQYELDSADRAKIAFAVHDQRDRPLMTAPMPLAQVKRGRDAVIFRTTIHGLGADVKRVDVEVALLTDAPSPQRLRPGETRTDKVAYQVK